MKKKLTKTKTLSPEEVKARDLENSLESTLENLKFVRHRLPTRTFEVGEIVKFGAMSSSKILEVCDGGFYYKVETTHIKPVSYPPNAPPIVSISERYIPWYDLAKNVQSDTKFAVEGLSRLNFGNTDLECLMHYAYFFGVDFDVDYQRGYVWNQEDKEALIESIFNGCDIGKFVFVRRPYGVAADVPLYEILDGKQRFTTMLDFVEDRITYKGVKFSEMSFKDRHAIESAQCSYAKVEADQYSKKQILELFYRLNRHGKVMDKAHLEKVKKMLEETQE